MTTPIVHETVRQIRKLAATGDGRRGRETPRRLPDSPLPPTQLEMETAKAEAEFKLKAQYPVRPYAVLTEGQLRQARADLARDQRKAAEFNERGR